MYSSHDSSKHHIYLRNCLWDYHMYECLPPGVPPAVPSCCCLWWSTSALLLNAGRLNPLSASILTVCRSNCSASSHCCFSASLWHCSRYHLRRVRSNILKAFFTCTLNIASAMTTDNVQWIWITIINPDLINHFIPPLIETVVGVHGWTFQSRPFPLGRVLSWGGTCFSHDPSHWVVSWVEEVVNRQPCPVFDVVQPHVSTRPALFYPPLYLGIAIAPWRSSGVWRVGPTPELPYSLSLQTVCWGTCYVIDGRPRIFSKCAQSLGICVFRNQIYQ